MCAIYTKGYVSEIATWLGHAKNEAINTSVVVYDPTNTTYSIIESLDVRVGIVTGIKILGLGLGLEYCFRIGYG